MSMLLETALAAAAAASPNLAQCTWDRPGHNPFVGDVVAAVDRYPDIPVDVRAKLKQRMSDRQYDELVLITRDNIAGKHRYDTAIRDMHFGAGQVCGTVTRAKWTTKTQERGMVYCESGHCVMVPTVCRNVSRVTRLPERNAAANEGPAGAGSGGTPVAMGSTLSFDPTSAGPLAGGGGEGGSPQGRSFSALSTADPAAAVSPTATTMTTTPGAGSGGLGGGGATSAIPTSGDSSGGSGGGSSGGTGGSSPGYFGGGGPIFVTSPPATSGGTEGGTGGTGGTTGPAVPGGGTGGTTGPVIPDGGTTPTTPTTPTGPDGGLAPGPGTDPTPAIPEPQTYVLMLAGLLAVGALARRRRRAPGTAG